jgi:RNA polymerase sigma-70 factor, ECF subfamily
VLVDMMGAQALTTFAIPPAERGVLALVRAARAGDTTAFDELMRLSERRLGLLAWRILGDREDAKDAVQETFLRLYRHLGRYDESSDFFGWLYRIAVNACRDVAKQRRRRARFHPLPADSRAQETPADDALASRDEVALLTEAIDALPEKERLAVILRELEELPTEDVAAILGSSASTVRVQVSKARAKLRAWIDARRKGAGR